MSVVRPEYGPTLPELVGPRFRALSQGARRGIVGGTIALLVLVLAVVVWRSTRDDLTAVVVREPVAFNLAYPPEALRRVDAKAPVALALEQVAGREPIRATVEPIDLPPYQGDPSAALLERSSDLIAELRRTDPDFVLRQEGRVRANPDTPGYAISYQTKLDGRTAYGQVVLLTPDVEPGDPLPQQGAILRLLTVRSPAVPNAAAVVTNGPLKPVFRSFRFGTERP